MVKSAAPKVSEQPIHGLESTDVYMCAFAMDKKGNFGKTPALYACIEKVPIIFKYSVNIRF